jgi:hypothetical protein
MTSKKDCSICAVGMCHGNKVMHIRQEISTWMNKKQEVREYSMKILEQRENLTDFYQTQIIPRTNAMHYFNERLDALKGNTDAMKGYAEKYRIVSLEYSEKVKMYNDMHAIMVEFEKTKSKLEKEIKHDYKTKLINLEMNLEIALDEEAVKKKKAIAIATKPNTPEPILQAIQKLPEELVKVIYEYLPWDVRVSLLECSLPSTAGLLHRISVADRFWMQIRRMPGVLRLLPETVVSNEVSVFSFNSNMTQKQKIKYVISRAKAENPKLAYEILRLIHVLIKPNKKYKFSDNYDRNEHLALFEFNYHDMYDGLYGK